MRYLLPIFLCLILAGCKTSGRPTPGSQLWYSERMTELDNSRAAGKLTDKEYFELKSDAEKIRAYYDLTYPRDPWTPPSYRRGFYPHHRRW